MIGWMIVYILAMPVFSLGLPLYAFWHMDDFTWGNTRLITGEHGRQVVITDEGKFDPDSIPKKRWEEFQAELWEAQTMLEGSHAGDDLHSEVSGYSYATRSMRPAMNMGVASGAAPSIYSGTIGISGSSLPPSRPMSQFEVRGHSIAPYIPQVDYARSRMSVAPSETFHDRRSHVSGGQSSTAELQMVDFTEQPSDDMLLNEIRDVLRTADLMTVTKKTVKLELERRFDCDLSNRRAYIGSGEFESARWCSRRYNANHSDSHGSRLIWTIMRSLCTNTCELSETVWVCVIYLMCYSWTLLGSMHQFPEIY